MANTNNLRLLTRRSRAHDLVVLTLETFAEIIRQLFKIVRDFLDVGAAEKLEACLETMQQRRRPGARLPRKRAAIPALFEVEIVFRVRNAGPTNEGGLDARARDRKGTDNQHPRAPVAICDSHRRRRR